MNALLALVLTLFGLACAALAWVFDPGRFHLAWLAALSLWLGWPLGCLALLFTHALTGGRWGEATRPALLAGVASLPLVLAALVPLGLGFHATYSWTHEAHDAGRGYLTEPFLLGRTIFSVLVWLGLTVLLLVRGAGPRLAAAGLILLAVTVTFASIDATEALDPSFGSSAWGMVMAAAMAVLAMALTVLGTAPAAPARIRADLARILLGLVVLWAYLEFVQFLIVWESDLPKESAWYQLRVQGGWYWITWAMVLLHFVVPFGALIFPQVQRSGRALAGVALMLVAGEVLRAWWVVLPAGGRLPSWPDVACVLAFVLVSLGMALLAPMRERAHA